MSDISLTSLLYLSPPNVMPCKTEPTAEERRATVLNTTASQYTPLLCSACRALERLGYDFDENPLLSQWWAKHQEEDAQKDLAQHQKRLQREIMKNILTKPLEEITPAERSWLSRTLPYALPFQI